MYIPKHFEITDTDEIFSFVESNAFGQIISNVTGRPYSSHIPFLVSDDRTKMIGHLAKQNPQHLELNEQEVLITLQGPHDYISPSWYASPGVPTWNYQAAHIYGVCQTFHDPRKLKVVLDDLTEKYENSLPTPWLPNYKSSMLDAVVGIEVTITEIQCKYKLSQNRPYPDQQNVMKELDSKGSNILAEAMARNEL